MLNPQEYKLTLILQMWGKFGQKKKLSYWLFNT